MPIWGKLPSYLKTVLFMINSSKLWLILLFLCRQVLGPTEHVQSIAVADWTNWPHSPPTTISYAFKTHLDYVGTEDNPARFIDMVPQLHVSHLHFLLVFPHPECVHSCHVYKQTLSNRDLKIKAAFIKRLPEWLVFSTYLMFWRK